MESAIVNTPSTVRSTVRFQPDVVLYHAECMDGFGAAWAIWKRYPAATFIPVKHGKEPPSGLEDQKIVMVDFSYSREIIEQMAASTSQFQILDHHITAQSALSDFPYAYFDMTKSGAVLAWEWAHEEPVPWLAQYIQDKDLWQWQLSRSREVSAALASYPFDFEVWDSLRQDILEMEGAAILRREKVLIEDIVRESILVNFEGETIPAVYSPILTSQIGEWLCQSYPFCIIWHQQEDRRYFSLRSRGGTVDVSAIAARYGGGGHVNAAGFSVSLELAQDSLLDPLLGLSLVK